MSPTAPRPLNVAIVGAGLGGLSAAIALRKQGHLVKVFEESKANKEIGAALTVPPNALRVLKSFGYEHKNLRSCEYRGMILFSSAGGKGETSAFKDQGEAYGIQGVTCHRTALHEELKRLALGEGTGTPVEVLLGTKIVDCDPAAGTLISGAGEKYEADVILGADGIRSSMRTFVLGSPVVAPPTGRCTFRWRLDASKLEGRPEFDWVLKEGLSGGRLVFGPDWSHSLFTYPFADGTMLNVTMMHPDKRDQDQHSWHSSVTREEVLEVYKDFEQPYKAFIELMEDPITLWQMRALPVLPTWINGKLAILGDAAHGTLPTFGQGAAIAIEDAAALGCMLPYGTMPEDVPSRLAAYQDLRKARGEFVCVESLEMVVNPSRGYLTDEQLDDLNGYDAIAVAQAHFNKTFVKP
ncbi:FAD/NAD(P)-binding domain-containing protein [Mycena rebaudengoi]|nr:FAD/NAD(P)-binding domain-containing protein [Mycena rebaudengoi]